LIAVGISAGAAQSPLPVGERVRVRGCGLWCCDDLFQHAVHVSKHIVIPEPKHEVSSGFEYPSSPCVFVSSNGVLTAVEFNDQMRISAKKIDNVTGDGHLAFKF
jgi:hypothetical protein